MERAHARGTVQGQIVAFGTTKEPILVVAVGADRIYPIPINAKRFQAVVPRQLAQEDVSIILKVFHSIHLGERECVSEFVAT